ncbi:MAG: hypothetical protein R3C03_01740 [Pirellulaceae bacterium]
MIDKSRLQKKVAEYYVGDASAVLDSALLPKVQDYRRVAGARMVPLERKQVFEKIPTGNMAISRKVDGEFAVLAFDQDNCFLINPGGTVRVGLPVLGEAQNALKSASITTAMIACELYLSKPDGQRERVHDVVSLARNPADGQALQQLNLAVFDILELDGQSIELPYADVWKKIETVFGKGNQIRPVETNWATTAEDVESAFEKIVVQGGAEGLVVRSDSAGAFKVKPVHTIDAVVVGFSESTGDREGMLHDLLLAVHREDGGLQVLCRVGGGFGDQLRRDLLADLRDIVVSSEYTEVSSDYVAYEMVRPEVVVEISCLDMISQSTRGAAIQRMVLNWDQKSKMYRIVRRLPLVSVISPQFIRIRDDKSPTPEQTGVSQVSMLVDVESIDRNAFELSLPKSELIKREVFTKTLKGETMVRKFVMWKTNKESFSADYPAFVVHFTDYSPNRAAPLAREVRISNDLEQIESLYSQLIESNIKKGWNVVDGANSGNANPEGSGQNDTASLDSDEMKSKTAKPAKMAAAKPRKKAVKKKGADKLDT